MADRRGDSEMLVWTDGRCAGLIGRVLGRMQGVRVLAVGGPSRSQTVDLAESLGAEGEDDLRRMLVERSARFLIVGTTEGLSRSALARAREAGTVVLAMEPLAADAAHLDAESEGRRWLPEVVPAPWLRMSPPWLAAARPQEAVGAIRSLHLIELGTPEVGSLYARLFDAMEMLVHLRGVPEYVDAALSGPLARAPDDLRALTGDLTAHLRFGDGAAAVVHASDRSAVWSRRLVVLGDEGQLAVDDGSYRLYGPDGEVVDGREFSGDPMAPDELLRRQFQSLVDERPASRPSPEVRAAVVCCQAALLSCRTGEAESPQTLMRIV